jgi:hypothetical protein
MVEKKEARSWATIIAFCCADLHRNLLQLFHRVIPSALY